MSANALSAVDALSPVDGRYRAATEPLRGLLSEAGLIRERIRVEAHWLLHLSASVPQLAGASLSSEVVARARQLAREPDADAAIRTAIRIITNCAWHRATISGRHSGGNRNGFRAISQR